MSQITEICHYFPQKERRYLEDDSWISLRNKLNTHMLYDCRDIGEFLRVISILHYIVDSPHLPKSVRNTMGKCGQ